VVACAAITAGIWGFFIEPRRLVIRREAFTIPHLRESVVVALISDVHVGSPAFGVERVREIAAEVRALKPDVILIAGDFLITGVLGGTYVGPADCVKALAPLQAPLGVYAVLGNHDWWSREGPQLLESLESAGINVLENESFEARPGSLWIAGLADKWTRTPRIDQALAGIPENAPILLLSHTPDIFPGVPARVSLTLAGHTHGGQVWLPLIGAPVVPSDYGERYAQGHIVEDGRHLYVTSGLGTSILPFRFGVPPEIVLLTLTSTSSR
jgi:predicted MPP superfamily phosphohydrolase